MNITTNQTKITELKQAKQDLLNRISLWTIKQNKLKKALTQVSFNLTNLHETHRKIDRDLFNLTRQTTKVESKPKKDKNLSKIKTYLKQLSQEERTKFINSLK